MRGLTKIVMLLIVSLTVSACAVSPGKPVENTVMQSQTVPGLTVERMTGADRQGVSTLNVVTLNGQLVERQWSNETSTSEQDMANIAVGAATGPLINAISANNLANKAAARSCSGDDCGGGQPIIVQAISGSESTSTSVSGGTCSGNVCLAEDGM